MSTCIPPTPVESKPGTSGSLSVLFWNVKGKDLGNLVQALAFEHSLDLIVLCELGAFNCATDFGPTNYHQIVDPAFAAMGRSMKVSFLAHKGRVKAQSVYAEHERFGILQIDIGKATFLLVGLHLISKSGGTEEWQQHLLAEKVAKAIAETEERLSIERTIVIGDFNMNPFEAGMYGGGMFNARPCRREISRLKRAADSNPPFYNPLWNNLGDKTTGPPGSFYLKGPGLKWNTIDQVLVRPCLIEALERVTMLTSAGPTELLTPKGVLSNDFSDHLPLFVKIKI